MKRRRREGRRKDLPHMILVESFSREGERYPAPDRF